MADQGPSLLLYLRMTTGPPRPDRVPVARRRGVGAPLPDPRSPEQHLALVHAPKFGPRASPPPGDDDWYSLPFRLLSSSYPAPASAFPTLTLVALHPRFRLPPPTDWQAPAGNGTNDRSPSPRGQRQRSRSRSPVRADPDRRDGGDRGRGEVRGGDNQNNPGNNIHVSGLSSRVEERDLDEVFGKYGRIQKTSIMRDPHTKDSRGFAFVTMELAEDADAAIAALNATELMGRTMNVEKARRGRARTPTPGQYHGPPKRSDPMDRPYEPRGYPSRGGPRGYDDRYEPRGGYASSSSRYDDRGAYGGRGGYDDRDGGRGGYAIPMRGDDRGAPRDDRRPRDYDDRGSRRYDDRDRYERRY
ncbi:hypothetical protein JCM11491_004487 [Sporobolomyces phaffii]